MIYVSYIVQFVINFNSGAFTRTPAPRRAASRIATDPRRPPTLKRRLPAAPGDAGEMERENGRETNCRKGVKPRPAECNVFLPPPPDKGRH